MAKKTKNQKVTNEQAQEQAQQQAQQQAEAQAEANANELSEEQKAIVEVVSEINNALGITPNQQAEEQANEQAEEQANEQANAMTDEEKNTIIKNTTKNQLEERAKRVQKEVNSLNGALKALYKEDVYKNLFDALDCKTYDEARAKVMQSIAYASNDNEGKFIAVTLEPIARFNNNTYYKVVKLGWFKAIAQATYRLARGLQRVQNVIRDSYYTKQEGADIWQEVEDSVTIAEIDKQIKADKYTKALAKLNKLKLEF